MDTLRDEACPVCGETEAWNGDECKVCDYVAPPSKFQDPDVDMHKKLDLRSDDQADMSAEDLNSAVNDQDGDGLDDRTGEPITDEDEMGADDVQPALVCQECGFEASAPEPMSISTEDPEAGSSGGQPVEGDLCPNCGQGLLVSTENAGMGMEGGGPDEDAGPQGEGDEFGRDAPPEGEGDRGDAPPEDDGEAELDEEGRPRDPEEEPVDAEEQDPEEEEDPANRRRFPGKR